MKHLVLHIGTHKTGTTSLQRFFSENKVVLEEKWRILYPESGRPKTDYENRYGHHLLARSFGKKNGVLNDTDWKKLDEECGLSDAKTILLSSEDFEGFGEKDILRLREYLNDYHVSVIIYLRNPLSFMRSSYKQQISGRSNLALSFRDFLDKNLHRCDYVSLFNRWKNAFGSNNIHLRVYDAAVNSIGIKEDFLNFLGIKDLRSFKYSPRINESVSDQSVVLARKLNKLKMQCVKCSLLYSLLRRVKRKIIRTDAGANFLISLFIPPLFSEEETRYLCSELAGKNDALKSYIGHDDFKYLSI